MISLKSSGIFTKTTNFIKKITKSSYKTRFRYYGEKGVAALASATPIDTGLTASSWGYEIEETSKKIIIRWTNSNVQKGYNIAVILQYGHGTNNGGYVQGLDYINPAIRPIFEEIVTEAWKEVTNS